MEDVFGPGFESRQLHRAKDLAIICSEGIPNCSEYFLIGVSSSSNGFASACILMDAQGSRSRNPEYLSP
ncbi:MAG TPA: hypothetical protein VG847_12075 [Chitinophagaceae bacterium]|nr:hypothetical protein [Chitinophagaceae bacterium]